MGYILFYKNFLRKENSFIFRGWGAKMLFFLQMFWLFVLTILSIPSESLEPSEPFDLAITTVLTITFISKPN